jgi:two-component system, sensor histidine kinase and response regulator
MDSEQKEIFNLDDFLNRMMQDRELAKSILDDFIAELPDKLEKLAMHIHRGNTREAADMAHLIKGDAASVGAEKMSLTACTMELAAKAADMDGLLGSLPSLLDNAALFMKTIEVTII